MTFNETHDTRRPLTITLAYCGCPAGDYRATIPRYNITANDDDPHTAVNNALALALIYLADAEIEAGAA